MVVLRVRDESIDGSENLVVDSSGADSSNAHTLSFGCSPFVSMSFDSDLEMECWVAYSITIALKVNKGSGIVDLHKCSIVSILKHAKPFQCSCHDRGRS